MPSPSSFCKMVLISAQLQTTILNIQKPFSQMDPPYKVHKNSVPTIFKKIELIYFFLSSHQNKPPASTIYNYPSNHFYIPTSFSIS